MPEEIVARHGGEGKGKTLMPPLNFRVWIEKVESGEKRQTIRLVRKRDPIEVGDRLILSAGARTKNYRRLFGAGKFWREPPVARSVDPVEIGLGIAQTDIWMEDRRLSVGESVELARADGFASLADLIAWFRKTHGLSFEGVVIRW